MAETSTVTTSPQPLTPQEKSRIQQAINHWHRTGAPQKAAVLRECLAQDRKAPANLVYFGDVQPETGVDPSKLQVPPRDGPGASIEVWKQFARETSDLDPEIIDKMTRRKDVIYMLETKGIIPKLKKEK